MLESLVVALEPATEDNVDQLVEWTLDPVAQGPYKRLPPSSAEKLHHQFLHSSDRQYFLIRRAVDGTRLGRFYWRAWRFAGEVAGVDWELNILIANPGERGKGYGTAAQRLAAEHLLGLTGTRSVFAYTDIANRAEQRALEKAGFEEAGELPNAYYRVRVPAGRYVLYVRKLSGE